MNENSINKDNTSILQPISAGIISALVGFSSSFVIVLQAYRNIGASTQQANSALFVILIAMGALGLFLCIRYKTPIGAVWSTPGAAFLAMSPANSFSYSDAIGAFFVSSLLIVVAAFWKPLSNAITKIPLSIANAMLAGILFNLCLAPITAIAAEPLTALPLAMAWLLAFRYVRLWATPITVLLAVVIIIAQASATGLNFSIQAPSLELTMPTFTITAFISLALPLFIITMASQNIPGIAILKSNGYTPPPAPLIGSTGALSALISFFGAHHINLAAISAAIIAGPDAHPDASKRYIAGITGALSYFAIAAFTGIITAFFLVSSPILIQAVAGLALLTSFSSALSNAVQNEDDRLPAIITFIFAASGLSLLSIGSAFWGLIAGLIARVIFKKPQ